VGLVAVALPRPASATVAARPGRTTVGSTTEVRLEVRGGRVPLVSPVVRVEGDLASRVLRLPTLFPGRSRTEVLEHRAQRRGVFVLGPVRHVQSDPLGLFRRTRSWGSATQLWVRPRVLVPSAFALGGVADLEGLPSDQVSMSDLAFHALREYVPGDDLRQVHWRSSAKANTLLVRQYHESRSMHAAFLVDDDPRGYASEAELETAISVAASLAIRALEDGYAVDLCYGDRTRAPAGAAALLDECCLWTAREEPDGIALPARAAALARTGQATGICVVVGGSVRDLGALTESAAAFGGETQCVVVRVSSDGKSTVRSSRGVRVLEVGRLEELPRLAAWTT
jgi:uncharacterized protein (DUF58 family)